MTGYDSPGHPRVVPRFPPEPRGAALDSPRVPPWGTPRGTAWVPPWCYPRPPPRVHTGGTRGDIPGDPKSQGNPPGDPAPGGSQLQRRRWKVGAKWVGKRRVGEGGPRRGGGGPGDGSIRGRFREKRWRVGGGGRRAKVKAGTVYACVCVGVSYVCERRPQIAPPTVRARQRKCHQKPTGRGSSRPECLLSGSQGPGCYPGSCHFSVRTARCHHLWGQWR